MKKLLFLSVVFAALTATAQQPMTASKDSTLNTDTSYLSFKIPGYQDVVSFQLVQTKTSGTVGGYAILQGSLDGTNYVNVNTDTCTFSNQSINTKVWALTSHGYTWYRIPVRTSGTQLSRPTGYVIYRKRQ